MEQQQNQSSPRKDPMDIEVIIDKIDKLPIPDADKASLLNQIKLNMMNPSHGEDENLNRIQAKYMQQPQPMPFQQMQIPFQSPQHMPFQQMPQMQMPQMPQMPYPQMPYPQMQMPQMPGNMMTTAHFEILKNKLDAVQLELVDLLRHVKDYTQRYMNATRQQDMEKIDSYVNGLFEVDKKMKEADEKAKEYEAEAPAEEPATRESIIGKATSGIKNFLGSIGDNVAGVASMVSNTANIANGYLSKKVIGSNTSNASPQPASGTINNTGTTGKANKNIVSVDDYIQSNMNEMEGASVNTPGNIGNVATASNMNNINRLESKNPSANQLQPPAPPTEAIKEATKEATKESSGEALEEASEEDITNAIKKLNDTMNEDIDNTVKAGNTVVQSGGRRRGTTPYTKALRGFQEHQLTKKIKLLRLKITKSKLENEVKKHTKQQHQHKNNSNRTNKSKRSRK